MNYYNEFDPFAAAWLKELISAGLLPKGDVDARDIREIKLSELTGYTQLHFFAGIGGWPYAFRLAGWPDDRPVWTGSCPCQPFSVAGKGGGTEDERHLWPAFRWIIAQLEPPTIFGEQVASKAGREWLAGVRADLEALGYAVGAADLCAAGISAPHIRQRLWWVADSECIGWGRGCERSNDSQVQRRIRSEVQVARSGGAGWVADSIDQGSQGRLRGRQDQEREDQHGYLGCSGATFWSNSYWHYCKDGKYRRVPVEPSLFPLAHGLPNRVGILRGAGNAVVPQVAAQFIKAFTEAQNGNR